MKEDVRRLSDDVLVDKLRELVGTERRILSQILLHLREVENRRLYSRRGYSSLFKYCVEELGYSESAAGRRIQAMVCQEQHLGEVCAM